MRLHILGICGTFMAGIAQLAKAAGHEVTGSDVNVYPPMSDILKKADIRVLEGYSAENIDAGVECVIVGNVITRGNPAIEYVLNAKLTYMSGPEWLAKNILAHKIVFAIAGTHGKTTTSSLLTWIFEYAGLNPGFLIGGVPGNFSESARIGSSNLFVIEADEYDSAFFDKRSKFIHYQPRVLVLNNLEFDHADIFPDLAAIERQFEYLIRTIPGNGLIIQNAQDKNLQNVLNKGCWTKVQTFGENKGWQACLIKPDGSQFLVICHNQTVGEVKWSLLGQHNVENALAALAAASYANISMEVAIKALNSFINVKRRLEIKGEHQGITLYDDFAHHPTAIAKTLAGLRAKVGKARIMVVLEFGSFTMRAGRHQATIQHALDVADFVICQRPRDPTWSLEAAFKDFNQDYILSDSVSDIVDKLVPLLKTGDHVVIMSNSGFGGLHQKLWDAIQEGSK